MDLLTYCRLLGIQIDAVPPIGVWKRYPTTDKPEKKNGAVKNMGTFAFVKNLATMAEFETWRPENGDAAPVIDYAEIARVMKVQQEARQQAAQKAAKMAGWVMHQTELRTHAYLAAKGFPELQGNVWTREKDGERRQLLVVPMRIGPDLVGVQMIAEDGTKRFLTGQRTDGAVNVIDNKGRELLVEGWATALSVREAMKVLGARYKIVCCFSAGNLGKLAALKPECFVVADNDASGTGERVARESGRPFFMPPVLGDDFNDWSSKVGKFFSSQALRAAMR
jgi:putative DNA primase/helicase